MAALIAALALAASPEVSSERAKWYDCLDRYAQVAMFGTRTTATLAMNALAVCAAERRALQMRVFRDRPAQSADDGPSLVAVLADEDRAAVVHVIAFMNRYRLSRR